MFSGLLIALRLKKKPAPSRSGPLLTPLPGWRRAEVVKFGCPVPAPAAAAVSEAPNAVVVPYGELIEYPMEHGAVGSSPEDKG